MLDPVTRSTHVTLLHCYITTSVTCVTHPAPLQLCYSSVTRPLQLRYTSFIQLRYKSVMTGLFRSDRTLCTSHQPEQQSSERRKRVETSARGRGGGKGEAEEEGCQQSGSSVM